MELHLKTIGILLILLSIIHVGFPKYFKWKEELKLLSIMNRQMMYIHSFFIALTVLLMGILCITSASELINTTFGRKISLGLCLFWTTRLFIQFFGYSSKNWKGKSFETSIHFVFTLFWSYLSITFLWVFLDKSF